MDSRSYAKYSILKDKIKPWKNALIFLGVMLGAVVLTQLFKGAEFSDSMTYALFILLFAVGLWVHEPIPPYAVALLIIGFEVYFFGSVYLNSNPDQALVDKCVSTWSSSVIWLMMGGFFLASSMKKTGLDLKVFHMVVNAFGKSPSILLLGLMLTTAILSMIMSNTATTAMMVACISPFISSLKKENKFKKALLLGVAIAASIGGMGTIIGSPPNAMTVGQLANFGQEVNFIEWMAYGLPISLVVVILFWLVLIKVFPFEHQEYQLQTTEQVASSRSEQVDRKITLVVMFVTVALWMTTPLHNIHVAAIAMLPIVFLTITGVLDAHDFRANSWDTLILVAGGLSLGHGITDTGLAKYYIDQVNLGDSYLLGIVVFAFVTMAFSNIMSNTATTAIVLPIVMMLFPGHELQMALVVGLSASCALLLPVSTPPNAIVFSTGALEQKDFRLGGLLIGVLGPLLIIGWILLLT